MTDLFFGDEPDLRDEIGREEREDVAKSICYDQCSLRIACLQFALVNKQEHGVWGGLSQGERREFKTWLYKQGYRPLPRGAELQANLIFWLGHDGSGLVLDRDRASRLAKRYETPERVEAPANGTVSSLENRRSRKRVAS